VKATADGYTLLAASQPNASNATLYEHLKFNFNVTSCRSPASRSIHSSWR
jgi:hypothetical protein